MSSFSIGPATDAERDAACLWLFPDGRAARAAALFASGEFDPAGLFLARTDRPCGAVLVQAMPGGVGLAWPPRGESGEVEDALIAAACGWLRERGSKACQAFAALDEVGSFAPLERHGFRRITQLVQMRRGAVPVPLDDLRLAVRFVQPDDRAEFARTLLATYADSLDCPELNAVRTATDSLGAVPERCYLARHEGRAVGVLALDDEGRELAYIGLIPEARGRGFGAELLRYAIGRGGDESALQLSVDVRNEPALHLYRRFGFVESDRREAFLVAWGDS